MKTRYMVVTAGSWQVLARNFSSWEAAQHWALSHDYGQWEDDGGIAIRPYTA